MTATDHLAALASPACYPYAPDDLRVLQTHLSVVCLADELVDKLKKAMTLPFVDFAPLAARRRACRDEVRLNRRLCPDVYLGTAALRRGANGVVRFAPVGDDDGGSIDLDVAVVMRRLPQARMLDGNFATVDQRRQAAVAARAAGARARRRRERRRRRGHRTIARGIRTADGVGGPAIVPVSRRARRGGHGR